MNALPPPHPPRLALWHRQPGLVLAPGLLGPGWSRHCQMPVPLMLADRLRLYFTARNGANQAHVFYAELEPFPPWRRIALSDGPVLAPGPLGAFDAAGVMPTAVVALGDEIRLYYIGWSVRADVPYHNAIGLAVSRDGGRTFTRACPGPVIGPGPQEPYFCGTGALGRIGDEWAMWYSSTTDWRAIGGYKEPRYHLKLATSPDGLRWRQDGRVALDYADEAEGGIACATVREEGAGRAMWFCTRALRDYRSSGPGAYRLGAATSPDGITWQRHPGPVFAAPPEPGAFDAHMQCYPALVEAEGGPYLFYCGNEFGQGGVGYASRGAA